MTKVKPPAVKFASGSQSTLTPRAEPVAASSGHTASKPIARPAPVSVAANGPERAPRQSLQFQVSIDTASIEPAGDMPPEPSSNVAKTGDRPAKGAQSSDAAALQSIAVSAETRRVDDEWRRWIAENLLVGQSPESILEAMKSNDFAHDDSIREINLASQSPYLRARLSSKTGCGNETGSWPLFENATACIPLPSRSTAAIGRLATSSSRTIIAQIGR